MAVRHITAGLAFVLLASLASVRPAAAQEPVSDESYLGMSVSMPVTVQVTVPRSYYKTPFERTMIMWRSYTPLEELRLLVRFENESASPLWISRAELRSAIRFGVHRSGTPLPASTQWLDEMPPGYDIVTVAPDATVLVEPQRGIAFVVALRRTDGETFDTDEYRVVMEMRNVRSSVRDPAGKVPNVRIPADGQFEYIVRVQPPANVAETTLRYILEAEDRASRDEFTAALTAYARAAAANPSDPSGMIGMAHMNVRLGRYREAIQLYETATLGGRDHILALFLARAYVGAGEDAKAVQTLRAGGAAETEIPGLIQDARDDLRADRSRFDRSPPPGR